MQKRAIVAPPDSEDASWLNIENEAVVEISSEDPTRPIESALQPGISGWRAATAGAQTIRLVFRKPRRISRVRLRFTETERERTQEFVLSWARAGGTTEQIVRQQWNFSPQGSTAEVEDYRLHLDEAAVLELKINPDIGGRNVLASLDELRVA